MRSEAAGDASVCVPFFLVQAKRASEKRAMLEARRWKGERIRIAEHIRGAPEGRITQRDFRRDPGFCAWTGSESVAEHGFGAALGALARRALDHLEFRDALVERGLQPDGARAVDLGF